MFNLEAAQNGRFEFQIEGDETTYSLPSVRQLPARFAVELARASRNDDGGGALDVFVGLLEKECGAGILDALNVDQLTALIQAWQDEGGISTGE